jgi:uncharacterized protein (DUF433 family)
MDVSKIITIEAGKRSGKPCIRGMRTTVYDVLDMLASGMSFDEIIEDFPKLTKEDMYAVLRYASHQEKQHLKTRKPKCKASTKPRHTDGVC